MKDFLGNPIVPGCWLACNGGGNRSSEYGMLLLQVLTVTDTSVRAGRLRKVYNVGGTRRYGAKYVRVTITNLTKYVVIEPPQACIDLFELVRSGDITKEVMARSSSWLHGRTEVF